MLFLNKTQFEHAHFFSCAVVLISTSQTRKAIKAITINYAFTFDGNLLLKSTSSYSFILTVTLTSDHVSVQIQMPAITTEPCNHSNSMSIYALPRSKIAA